MRFFQRSRWGGGAASSLHPAISRFGRRRPDPPPGRGVVPHEGRSDFPPNDGSSFSLCETPRLFTPHYSNSTLFKGGARRETPCGNPAAGPPATCLGGSSMLHARLSNFTGNEGTRQPPPGPPSPVLEPHPGWPGRVLLGSLEGLLSPYLVDKRISELDIQLHPFHFLGFPRNQNSFLLLETEQCPPPPPKCGKNLPPF